MKTYCGKAIVVALLALLAAASPAISQQTSKPTSKPAASQLASTPSEFGQTMAGLSAGAALEGKAVFGGKQTYVLAVRNQGKQAVPLGEVKDAFAWLLIAQGKDTAYFSGRVALASLTKDWPAELAGDATLVFSRAVLKDIAIYRYEKGDKIAAGYPVSPAGEPIKPAGKLDELLTLGKAKAKWMIYLPATPDRGEMLLASNSIEVMIEAPRLAGLSAPARAALVADLLKQFDRDAWSAQQAHDHAVKLGKDLLPDLIDAVAQKDRPDHARMWLATAIADMPSEKAVAALTKLLDDPADGVQCVVAYYGPKQNSKSLDKAITDKAQANPAGRFMSYAMLGYMVFRSRVPEDLLKAGLESEDPRTRATAAQSLAGMASDFNKTRLNALLADKDPRVRAVAQKILDAMKTTEKQ